MTTKFLITLLEEITEHMISARIILTVLTLVMNQYSKLPYDTDSAFKPTN